jgi:hypothetical protein
MAAMSVNPAAIDNAAQSLREYASSQHIGIEQIPAQVLHEKLQHHGLPEAAVELVRERALGSHRGRDTAAVCAELAETFPFGTSRLNPLGGMTARQKPSVEQRLTNFFESDARRMAEIEGAEGQKVVSPELGERRIRGFAEAFGFKLSRLPKLPQYAKEPDSFGEDRRKVNERSLELDPLAFRMQINGIGKWKGEVLIQLSGNDRFIADVYQAKRLVLTSREWELRQLAADLQRLFFERNQ